MRHHLHILPFLLVLAGCASSARPASTPAFSDLVPETVFAPAVPAGQPVAAPQAAGDIQFTMTERKGKSEPASDETAPATTLAPMKSYTSGVTSTGVMTQQHVHAQ